MVTMGSVIPLRSEDHEANRELLPWYVTGKLEGDERASVEAHLAGCADCQAELRFQRRLREEVAGLPVNVEHGWAEMRRRLAAEGAVAKPAWAARLKARVLAPVQAPWLGWAAACTFALVAGVALLPDPRPAQYHTLSAAPPVAATAAEAGNVVVIFRPETTEKALRGILNEAGARLVDGPTEADAYVLRVAPARRAQALAKLRAEPEVSLAQPIDPEISP
jgi:anti-sigma factor RsiW